MAILPKVSIIVPVYKAEKYIKRCLDSILSQTFTNFELLLVDDGSPDKSGEICDSYALIDSRIKVLHKENGGVGLARQLGLDSATGEYTIHVDPDDWVEPTMLEELYYKAKIEEADVVVCDYWEEYSNRQELQRLKITSTDPKQLISRLVDGSLHGSLWNKLIRRDFMVNHHIYFAEGLNICEDLTLCLKVLSQGAKVAYLNRAFYHYDKFSNPNALTSLNTRFGRDQHDRWLTAFRNIFTDRKSRVYRTGVTYIAYWAFTHMIFSSKEYRDFYKDEICSFLLNDRGVGIKVITVLCALGFNAPILYLYRVIKKY